jgi:hypothetical protein
VVVAPNRRLNAVHLPHFAIREPDLAAGNFFAAGFECGPEQGGDAISLGERYSAGPRGESRNLTIAGQSGDDFVSDRVEIEHFGHRSHTAPLSEVVDGTNDML